MVFVITIIITSAITHHLIFNIMIIYIITFIAKSIIYFDTNDDSNSFALSQPFANILSIIIRQLPSLT